MKELPFSQVNAFSVKPYLGNPLAVIHDATGVSDEEMQRIARWTNLSETTFLLPPTSSEADYRVRIFSPGGELPFAGHPTIGSAHAWLEMGGIPRNPELIVQECGAGLINIKRENGILSFCAPPTFHTGEIESELLDKIVKAFGITHEQVISHQWIDNGPGWSVVQLGTAAEVLEIVPDFSDFPEAMVGAYGAYPEGSEFNFELRSFAPGVNVFEDPVCGSMNASLGQWLVRKGEVKSDYRVSQGQMLTREGEISMSVDSEGNVWVGGVTTTLFAGTALVASH